MNNIKVALVSHEFPPYTIGGIANHCYDLAFNLSNSGIDTKVICGNLSGFVKRVKINPLLEVISIPILNLPPRYLFFQFFNHKKLCTLLADRNVIHGVNPIASLGPALHYRKSDKVLITTHHLNELQTLKTFMQMQLSDLTFGDLSINALSFPINDFMEKMWFKIADRIIVPGLSTYRYMCKSYPKYITEKISIIYNGINFAKIQKVINNNLSKANDDFSIVCFGRLISHKGVAVFLRNSKTLFDKFPDIKLKIFGKGPILTKLVKIIRKNNLTKNVKLMGHVPYEELIAQISKATVAVFPSFLEVGPYISALEAMACKKPVVAFNFPFNREFLRHMRNGVLAKPGDMRDMIDKIELLLTDKKLRCRIGQNAYEYVKKWHDWKFLAQKYIKIYEESLQIERK